MATIKRLDNILQQHLSAIQHQVSAIIEDHPDGMAIAQQSDIFHWINMGNRVRQSLVPLGGSGPSRVIYRHPVGPPSPTTGTVEADRLVGFSKYQVCTPEYSRGPGLYSQGVDSRGRYFLTADECEADRWVHACKTILSLKSDEIPLFDDVADSKRAMWYFQHIFSNQTDTGIEIDVEELEDNMLADAHGHYDWVIMKAFLTAGWGKNNHQLLQDIEKQVRKHNRHEIGLIVSQMIAKCVSFAFQGDDEELANEVTPLISPTSTTVSASVSPLIHYTRTSTSSSSTSTTSSTRSSLGGSSTGSASPASAMRLPPVLSPGTVRRKLQAFPFAPSR